MLKLERFQHLNHDLNMAITTGCLNLMGKAPGTAHLGNHGIGYGICIGAIDIKQTLKPLDALADRGLRVAGKGRHSSGYSPINISLISHGYLCY